MPNPVALCIATANSASCPPKQPYPIETESLTLRNHPGDAFCQKTLQNAPPNFDPQTQLIETTWLKTSQLTTPHTPARCVTRRLRVPRRQHRAFRPAPGLV